MYSLLEPYDDEQGDDEPRRIFFQHLEYLFHQLSHLSLSLNLLSLDVIPPVLDQDDLSLLCPLE